MSMTLEAAPQSSLVAGEIVTGTSFVLDEGASFELFPAIAPATHPRWMEPSHLTAVRYALILLAGEGLRMGPVQLDQDSALFLRISTGLAEISPDGLVCVLQFQSTDSNHMWQVGEFALAGKDAVRQWRTIELDLAWLAGASGHLIVRCTAGPENDPVADWLAISDLCLAREDDIPVLLARTHRERRVTNELKHFDAVYQQDAPAAAAQGHANNGAMPCVTKLLPEPFDGKSGPHKAELGIAIVEPVDAESAYDYALRLLRMATNASYPDYAKRLRDKVLAAGSVKVLSLCCGAARHEAKLARGLPAGVEWTFLDINENLLQMAARRFPANSRIRLIEADANDLVYSGEQWDIIICVSALHHLVELEKVAKFISDSLAENGEFWSVGEAVGRNGNRLWPDARRAANSVFAGLPQRLRFNHYSQEFDDAVPDVDYSISSFEGIRSGEILPLLYRWFQPLEIEVWNCFLWRLLDGAYIRNFDLSDPADLRYLAAMVEAELEHYRNGGRGTELYGFFKRRELAQRWLS